MFDANDVWSKPTPEPQSPCTNNCVVSSVTGYCDGCYRSMKEIVEWDQSTSIEKTLILSKLEERRKQNETTPV